MILKKKNGLLKVLIGVACVLAFFFLSCFLFYFYTETAYRGKIMPNVYIGTVNLSGKTMEEARGMINQKIDLFNLEGLVFKNAERVYIYPIESLPTGEVSSYLVSFDIEEALNRAVITANSGNPMDDFLKRVELFILQKKDMGNVVTKVDHEKVLKKIEEKLFLYFAHNAYYQIGGEGQLEIKKEVQGRKFSYNVDLLEKKLSLLDFTETILIESDYSPEITEVDCLKKKSELEEVMSVFPVYLTHQGEYWIIDKNTFIDWVILKKSEGVLILSLNKEKVSSYIKSNISNILDTPAEMPKFTIEDGKLKDFVPGKDGLGVDVVQMSEDMEQIFLGENNFEVKFKITRPVTEIASSEGDFLGIKELIGESFLSFAGSSASRIKNIKNGASKINGVIIKPGEEFSTIKTLSPIEISNGYAKEAVINGGAITYEVGGGLCHLSTTLFRSILTTGLPITMRKNHTYDMSYYTPAGIDAAIYDPTPDFRFVNDMPTNVLLVAWVEGVKLNIQIWGTNDGRTVKRTDPVRYNIVRPKAAKILQSTSLATGVTQCSYAAYTGSDTHFDYIVTYPDGSIKEERFKSHYSPRQGICYVGV